MTLTFPFKRQLGYLFMSPENRRRAQRKREIHRESRELRRQDKLYEEKVEREKRKES